MENTGFKSSTVGILGYPGSERDLREGMAKACGFQDAEMCQVIQGVLLALANVGVSDVVLMPSRNGIAARMLHAGATEREILPHPLPELHFIETPLDGSPVDIASAVEQMVEMGVGAIIVVGGDWTHNLVAKSCGATPIVPLPAGANNSFPEYRKAMVAGTAAGLVVTGAVPLAEVSLLNKVLRIEKNHELQDLALRDLCLTSEPWLGARTCWHPEGFSELFVTFAEADAVGLASIPGLLHPVGRRSPYGLRLALVPPGDDVIVISAPIAGGLRTDVGVAKVTEIRPKEVWRPYAARGVATLDGEREIEFGPFDRIKIWLETEGPTTIDVREVMAKAAENHYFAKFPVQAPQQIMERRDELVAYLSTASTGG